MEFFKRAKVVRLKSHHETYLMADEDEENVIHYESYGLLPNTASWTVELVKDFDDTLRLKSCCGKYLTATETKFLLGATGRIVKQTMPIELDSSVEWKPINVGEKVMLQTKYGNYLRANGGVPPPWNNSITHDKPYSTRHTDWIVWEVEVVEIRQEPPKKILELELPTNIPMLESMYQVFSSNKSLLVIFFVSIMSTFFISFILFD